MRDQARPTVRSARGLVVAAGACVGVEVLRPGVPVAGAVGERVERLPQPFVAAPAERRGLAFAGLFCDCGLASVAGECVAAGVALAAVADLGQQLRRGDHAAFEEREEDWAVGMLADLGGLVVPLELLDLLADEFDHRDQRQDQLSAKSGQFMLANATGGRTPELGQQL